MFRNLIFHIWIKKYLTLNFLQSLICLKTKPNEIHHEKDKKQDEYLACQLSVISC